MMEVFKSDLRKSELSDLDIVKKYIICGTPYVFKENESLYFELKNKISEHFQIEITRIFLIGSAKLGFSIAPDKLWKKFNEKTKPTDKNSDLDIVIISSELFETFWKKIFDFNINLHDRTVDENTEFSKFLGYFFRGWIRPDLIPKKFKLADDWFDYFRSISYKEFGTNKITGAIFKDDYFFNKYHESNIHLIRKGGF